MTAIAEGIIITTMNTQIELDFKPSMPPKDMATLVLSFMMLVTLWAKKPSRAGLQAGDKAFLWGLESQPGRGERTKGVSLMPSMMLALQ
jgi:hypothetical protein